MPLYDLMLLLDPGVPTDRHDAILKEVTTLLESGGNIVTDQEWGTRRIAFEIDHRPEADYHLYQFETEPGGALLERVDHSLKIMDGVLRHRIIRLKDGTPPPVPPRPEGRYAEGAPVEPAPAAEAARAAPAEQLGAAPAEPAVAPPEPPAAPAQPATAPYETEAPAGAERAEEAGGDERSGPTPA